MDHSKLSVKIIRDLSK